MPLFVLPPPADPSDQRIVVGYARVSTNAGHQALSIEGQVREFERIGVDRIIAERQSASDGSRRPGWEELNLLVVQRRVRLVLMHDLSRLARDGSDLQLLEHCAMVGTEVRDLFGHQWEVESVGGLLSAGVTSLMNRVQARMIGLKAKDGLRRRREAGYLARGVLPFGYRAGERAPEPDPRTWVAARQLVDLFIQCEAHPAATIKALPADFPWIPVSSALTNWIRNPMLRGGIGYERNSRGWGRVEWGKCPPLITEQEYDHIETLIAKRRRGPGGGQPHQRLFSSLIQCKCKSYLTYRPPPKETHAKRYQCRNPRCEFFGRTVQEAIIREAVAVQLVRKARRMEQVLLSDQPAEESPELTKLRTQLRQLEELDSQGVEGLRATICRLRDQIANIQKASLGDGWLHPDYKAIFNNPDNFRLARDEDLRIILLHLVRRIEWRFPEKSVRVVFRA